MPWCTHWMKLVFWFTLLLLNEYAVRKMNKAIAMNSIQKLKALERRTLIFYFECWSYLELTASLTPLHTLVLGKFSERIWLWWKSVYTKFVNYILLKWDCIHLDVFENKLASSLDFKEKQNTGSRCGQYNSRNALERL